MLGQINGKLPEPKKKIPGIKSLHQFVFQNGSMVARRVPGIGKGIVIDMTNKEMEVNTSYDYTMVNADEMVENLPQRRTSKEYLKSGTVSLEPVYNYEEEKCDDVQVTQSGTFYRCTKNPLCSLQFIGPVNYFKHVEDAEDPCKIRVVHPRHRDLFISMNVNDFRLPDNANLLATEEGKLLIRELQKPSAQKLDGKLSLESTDLTSCNQPLVEQFVMGHGLPFARVVVHFDIDVHIFAYELFKIGQESAHQKVKASRAVELMKTATKPDGSLRFPDWKKLLDERQVFASKGQQCSNHNSSLYLFFQFKSLFSTIARKIRDKTFVDPSLVVSKKRQRTKPPQPENQIDANRQTKVVISEEDRRQFEEEFRDFDFSELSDQDMEKQEMALESFDKMERDIEVKEFLQDVENVAQKEITDDGHPILVSSLSRL